MMGQQALEIANYVAAAGAILDSYYFDNLKEGIICFTW